MVVHFFFLSQPQDALEIGHLVFLYPGDISIPIPSELHVPNQQRSLLNCKSLNIFHQNVIHAYYIKGLLYIHTFIHPFFQLVLK